MLILKVTQITINLLAHNVKILGKKPVLNQSFGSPVQDRKRPVKTDFLRF